MLALRDFIKEPDVYVALDPEFAMINGIVPGKKIGTMRAADINAGGCKRWLRFPEDP